MEAKVNQIWEWDIDREHISVLRVKEIIASTHELEVICEVLEGENKGTCFQTSMTSFESPNWRFIKDGSVV